MFFSQSLTVPLALWERNLLLKYTRVLRVLTFGLLISPYAFSLGAVVRTGDQ
ncbi:hypothetical protein NTH_00561 [Nitratireductor thuwali]|uniref:Uncharacterized protein n=1 Tax=Nitratireductor thuwali TaxID=2267699 RepID=A0ABY5MFU1_9HYPH|nr:hypothetical protein NTH_00561 [Nitratireductor thuwali]